MSGIRRREFLAAGAAATLGCVFPPALQDPPRKIKGVIWLWMGGGMSQIDTWDPKPGHKNGGDFKAIDTTVRDIQLSEHMHVCASQMQHLALIRSMATHEGSHEHGTYLMHTGRRLQGGYDIPSIGTVLAFELGRKQFPLPPHIAIDPPLIPQASPFGDEYLPFRLNNADNPIPNVRPTVDAATDRERALLLKSQNQEWGSDRRQEEVSRVEASRLKAEEMTATPLLEAFNYKAEPAALRAEYGDRFGINCLLARRLVEAGCAFVEIGLGGWDMRADNFGNLKRMLPTCDAGLGTLIKDLAGKNLIRDVLVVCATEFGRTPSINAGKGRDHHADGFTIVLAGGGLKGGRVHGNTGPDGQACADPVSPSDLFATIYKACGVDWTKTYDAGGRSFRYVQGGAPLADLF
jgi:hypothetical protein